VIRQQCGEGFHLGCLERSGSVTDDHAFGEKSCSRRNFLHMAGAGGGAVLGIGLIGSRAAAAASKVPKQTVSYQPSPKGQARCGSCAFFEAPSACNYVDGPINPNGWCVLYKAKG
jgi:hypothetical protein